MEGTIILISNPDTTNKCESYQDDSDIPTGDNAALVVETMGANKTHGRDSTAKFKKHEISRSPVKEFFTNVTHGCVLVYFLLIWYLCLTHEFVFFTWHPLLLSLGWLLLMTEAILILSKENPIRLKLKLKSTAKVRSHWIPLAIAAVLILIGFIVITISKNEKHKNHYTSWHGLLGLIGIVACIPPYINGVLLLYDANLKNYIKPKTVKFVHVASGAIAFTFGGLSLILSVYTNWFARNTENSAYLFYFSLIIVMFPIVWTAQRPLLKCYRIINERIHKN